MSYLGRVGGNQAGQTVHQTLSQSFTSTMVKTGAVVLGLLFIGAGTAMYFLNVNAIATYVAGGLGGVTILGVLVWNIIDYLRGENGGVKDIGVKEFILDLSEVEGTLKITEEEVAELLKNNPNLKKLRIKLPLHRMDTKSDPDFKALDAHFKRNFGQSSGTWDIYDRK